MIISQQSKAAAMFWHARIGRFLTNKSWEQSLRVSYPKAPSQQGVAAQEPSKKTALVRLGGCGASSIMIDANSAVLIDEIDVSQLPGIADPECDFQFGPNIRGEVSITKTQINWALAPERPYPFLMVRPSRKGCLPCLVLTESENHHIVCIPDGNLIYDAVKVRAARDLILSKNLQDSWKRASELREVLSRNEHMLQDVSDKRRQKILDEHEALIKLFPLDVWLPNKGTGEFEALNNVLAVKRELPISSLPKARDIHLQSKQLESARDN